MVHRTCDIHFGYSTLQQGRPITSGCSRLAYTIKTLTLSSESPMAAGRRTVQRRRRLQPPPSRSGLLNASDVRGQAGLLTQSARDHWNACLFAQSSPVPCLGPLRTKSSTTSRHRR